MATYETVIIRGNCFGELSPYHKGCGGELRQRLGGESYCLACRKVIPITKDFEIKVLVEKDERVPAVAPEESEIQEIARTYF